MEPLTPVRIGMMKAALSPAQTLALTAWAEARSRLQPGKGWVKNPPEAMADVMSVVVNRVADPRWKRRGVKGVCLQPYQFSCWLPRAGADTNKDPEHLADNFEALMEKAQILLDGGDAGETLQACLAMAEQAVGGTLGSEVGAATHYYATWIPAPKWAAPPAVMTAERFGHRFFERVA